MGGGLTEKDQKATFYGSSNWGWFSLPGNIHQRLEAFYFDCPVLASIAQKLLSILQCTGQLPTTKDDPTPHVSSAEGEKSLSGVTEMFHILIGYMGLAKLIKLYFAVCNYNTNLKRHWTKWQKKTDHERDIPLDTCGSIINLLRKNHRFYYTHAVTIPIFYVIWFN